MFVVILKFSDKSKAPPLMDAHNAWIRQGFDDGVFALVGSLQPAAGGAILAYGLTREAVEQRVGEDPFVAQGVVQPQIIEIAPSRVDDRLVCLKD